jgi:hypothetical protein
VDPNEASKAAVAVAMPSTLLVLGATTARAAGSDKFQYSTDISSLPYSVYDNTSSATHDVTDPESQCGHAISNVWFQYRAETSQIVHLRLDTGAAGWVGAVAVYRLSPSGKIFRASPPTDWQAVGCRSGLNLTEEITFDASPGETYRIEVGGSDGHGEISSAGEFDLDVYEVPRPTNDAVIDATPLNDIPSSVTGSGYGATFEPGEPLSSCDSVLLAETLWYRYTEATGGDVVATNEGSDYMAGLSVFTGPSRPLVEVACMSAPWQGRTSVQFTATAGTTYWIQLSRAEPDGGQVATGVRQLAPQGAR